MIVALLALQALQPSPFEIAAGDYISCLRAAVHLGMTTRMPPEQFRAGFANACREQEARFRIEAIRMAMAQGRTEAEAIAEIDGNIANGRRIFAADQEHYVQTGRVPR